MAETTHNPRANAAGSGNGALGLRRTADPTSGRPPTPTPDPRVEASKTWPAAARAAARKAFEKATSGGASREEAIEAAYREGLRRVKVKVKEPPPLPELVTLATKLLGARVVAVLPPPKKRKPGRPPPLEERCFEKLFPDEGFPDPPAGAAATLDPESGRSESDHEGTKTDDEQTRQTANPPKQATFDFG